MDASIRQNTWLTTIGYIMKDKHANSIMAAGKEIGNVSILVTEWLAIREAMDLATQQNLQRIIFESD